MYTKDIVFCIPGTLRVGAQDAYISFPLRGTISAVKTFCVEPGAEDTRLLVEKISKEEFESQADNWVSLTEGEIVIPAGKRISDPIEITNPPINEGDYFRIFVAQVGTGFKNLTMQISVTI
jgi:hypothetical protein